MWRYMESSNWNNQILNSISLHGNGIFAYMNAWFFNGKFTGQIQVQLWEMFEDSWYPTGPRLKKKP